MDCEKENASKMIVAEVKNCAFVDDWNTSRKAHRQFTCLVAVTCLACLTTGLSVLVTLVFYRQMQELREELRTIPRQFMPVPQLNQVVLSDAQEIPTRQARSSETKPCRKNRKKNSRSRKCRRQARKTKTGLPGREQQHDSIRKDVVPTKEMVPLVVSGHYVSNKVDFKKINLNIPGSDQCENKWDGIVCRNLTFQVSGDVKLKFLKPALWTKNSSIQLPFDHESGNFRVKKRGVYLLYLQVLFDDRAAEESIRIVCNNRTIFKCFESDDDVEYGPGAFLSNRRKNCNLIGLRYLHENDTVSLYASGRFKMEIQLSEENTYFGATLIHPNL
ncbi:hypothetical protein ScPMuIL_018283 [Solemya velum]